jgi:hypothetical protein
VSLGLPASRPGAGPTRRPKWHWLIAALAVAVVAGGLVVRPWSRTSPAVPTVNALDGTAVVVDSAGIGGAPARWIAGVPVGWPQTEEGAIGAAAAYARVLSALWFLGDTHRRQQALTTMAIPESLPGLQAAQDQVATGIARGPFGAGLARPGVRSVLRTSLLGYRVDRYTPTDAEVLLWAVVIYGNDGGLVPQALWATSSLRLRWAGDWKLVGTVTVPGPVPVQGQAAPSAVSELMDVAERFKEFSYAPAG